MVVLPLAFFTGGLAALLRAVLMAERIEEVLRVEDELRFFAMSVSFLVQALPNGSAPPNPLALDIAAPRLIRLPDFLVVVERARRVVVFLRMMIAPSSSKHARTC